jgi:8-oxo-dGTP diphosphatase
MRSAYGAEEIGIGGHLVTIVVDVANVMGSRPDGWWRDRAGAAARLHAQVVRLAASGQAIGPVLPDGPGNPAQASDPARAIDPARAGYVRHADGAAEPGDAARSGDACPAGFVMVLEGAARGAVNRIPPGEVVEGDGLGTVRPGEVRVVLARGSGDDMIVAVVRELPGRRVAVTADRELRARCMAAGAAVVGPGWLLSLLRGPGD